MSDAVSVIKARLPGAAPKLGLILGSGLGGLVDEIENPTRFAYTDLPGFPHSTVSSHAAELVIGTLSGLDVAVLAGRVHAYETGLADAMATPLATLKGLGVESLILTNAAGSLHEDMGPGSLMLISDHINFSGRNPLIGVDGDGRFANMVDAYDPAWRAIAKQVAEAEAVELHEGVYGWFLGPSFETPAEIRMARTLGMDAVGMSTVPETILARYHGMRVLGISSITNLGAGMTGDALSHHETKDVGATIVPKLTRLIRALLADMAGR
ncbi:MAG: purine-nucleoside phosphorylase [Devosiaceae bacterium]|nr:purine-nucleoside phosphorylase [Devosiaceae bacterium MH13]